MHSFSLIHSEYIDELQATVSLYRHQRFGTPVLAIKNNDSNKTFCLAFQTVPEDSTGVAHILEHSVLMGSRKYPVRDVFGEINKGGLMTFLNAMTGSDTTWYPFATRNLQEYFNIMDVYCDVCFHPLLEKTTFEQEGWHYHLEETKSQLQIQGVVFNEMKGAFSDPIRALFHHTYRVLLPDSTYAHESGGDPTNIPDLLYEQFVTFHRKHYHPGNAMVFFYGDAPLNDELAYLHKILAGWPDDSQGSVPIQYGQPITKPVFFEDTYCIQPESSLEGKTFLAVGSVVGNACDRKQNACFQVIANILFNSDASPLKQAIVSAGLCKDFGGLFLGDSCYHTIMMTYLIGSDSDKRDTFLQIYKDALQEMIQGGLDPDLVLSELNKYEFSVREEMSKSQRGLDLISHALPALKYGADAFDSLRIEALLLDIRQQAIHERLFEQLIEQYLLNNQATAILTLSPDPHKLLLSSQNEQIRLQNKQASLSQEELGLLTEHTRFLTVLQQQASNDTKLAMLPRLKTSDLERTIKFFSVQPDTFIDRPLLISELDTKGICYLDLGFDCSGLDLSLLPYLNLFGTIVTEIGTKDKDYMMLAKELGICTGGLSHSFTTYTRSGESATPRPIFWLHLKALSSFLDQALALLVEILQDVNFLDIQRLAEICAREFAWAEHAVQSEGYNLASTRVFSHLSVAGCFNEQVNGATSYLATRELVQQMPAALERLPTLLSNIHNALFQQSGLTVTVTGSVYDISQIQSKDALFRQVLGKQPPQAQRHAFPLFPDRQAFTTSSEVLYNVLGGALFPEGAGYNGHFEVLKSWLSRDYLWNTVRQSGGAYGAFIQFSHISGNIAFVSYRDPHLKKTYQTYQNIGQQLEKLELSETGLQQLVIGSYGKFDPHQSPASLAATACNEYLSGITPSSKQQHLDDLLQTTVHDLRRFADAFHRLASNHKITTIGNKEKITANHQFFEHIQQL